jgi:uncharacterized damage-inducible protein DinB
MSTLAPLIEAWDEGHREFAIALGGLPDEDLWTRAHPRLLSVGELAGHVAYGQAIWTMGDGSKQPDLEPFPIKSPLIDHAFRYYLNQVDQPVKLDIGTARVLDELTKIHQAARSIAGTKESDDIYPGHWRTWGNLVQYQAFHVAYHTGQAYSVRHLMGHETEDN